MVSFKLPFLFLEEEIALKTNIALIFFLGETRISANMLGVF